jgi:hypothetical protein
VLARSSPAQLPNVLFNLASFSIFTVAGALAARWAMDRWNLSPDEPGTAAVVAAVYVQTVILSFVMMTCYGALAYRESIREALRFLAGTQAALEVPMCLVAGVTAYVYGAAGLAALGLAVLVQLVFVYLIRELVKSHRFAADLQLHAERIAELWESRGRLVGQVLVAVNRHLISCVGTRINWDGSHNRNTWDGSCGSSGGASAPKVGARNQKLVFGQGENRVRADRYLSEADISTLDRVCINRASASRSQCRKVTLRLFNSLPSKVRRKVRPKACAGLAPDSWERLNPDSPCSGRSQ